MNGEFLEQCIAVQIRRQDHDEEQAMLLIGIGFIAMAAKDQILPRDYWDWRN